MVTPQPELLAGVKILDLTSVVFGPYCTQTLADLGADVIKVESPAGDPIRGSGGYAHTPEMGALHMTLNRGKRSIVLDLKQSDDRHTMAELIASVDVFIHNLRHSAIERLGFDYEQTKALNKDIIYVHCVGYGSDGPYADLPAYDDVIQAASGLTSLPSRVDGNPTPRYLPTTLVDKVAGLHAVYATIAACLHKLRTGRGQMVEVPMLETFTHFLLEEHLAGGTFDPPVDRIGYRRQIEANRQPFRTADGHISIVPYGDANWIKLFGILGRPDLLEDPQLSRPENRAENVDKLYKLVGELTPARTTADWMDRLGPASIPAMPVRNIEHILDDPHLKATGFFQHCRHPTEGAYYQMRPPVRFSDVATGVIRPAPLLGEHSDEVRAELRGAASTDRRRPT